jgi:flagellar basal body rod protein FlgG
MVHEVCGTAYYCGSDIELIKEFGRFKETELYNCEGFYVLDSNGKQVVINKDWTKKVEKYNPVLNGKDITRIYTHHENIVVVDNNDVAYFMDPYDLKNILKRHKFRVEKKRTRVWITKD